MKQKITSALNNTFSSLKYKNFRCFWIGQCVSLIGTWMQRTAQVWLVYSITKSPLLVGLLGVCQFMPMLLFTLFAGVLVDRFPKRRILIFTQSVFMTLGFTMTLLVYLDIIRYWQVLIITALFGFCQTVDMPARQSFVIELVGKDDVMNGISLNSTIFNLAKIIGPIISGFIMVNFGAVFCFFIDSVSYIAVIFGLFLIKTEPAESKNVSHNVFQDVKDGLKYIRESEALVINSLVAAAICTFAFNNDVIIPVFTKTVLHQGARVYTNLMSAVGIGAFIGAMVMATIAKNGVRKNIFLFDSVLLSSLQVLMLFVRNFYLSFIMLVLIGFVGISFLNLCNSIYQVNTIDQYRGRVMSVYAFLNQGSTPLGNLYVGSVMERFSGISGFPACGAAALIFLIPIFIYKRNTIVSWLRN